METSKEKVNISLTEGTKELIIRQGAALAQNEPVRIIEKGTINSPSTFTAIRKAVAQTALVTYSRSEMRITYAANPEDKHAPVITGTMLSNPDLEKFKINKSESGNWSLKSLASFIKMNRMFFSSTAEEVAKLVTDLNAYRGKIVTEVEQSQDSRGNSKSMLERKIESNTPVEFKLSMPLFVGYKAKEFRIEICFDGSDAGMVCWLESPELQELILKERDRIIDEEIKKFTTDGLIVIEQ